MPFDGRLKMRIKCYDDYHEIQDTKVCKSIELGCFPTKDGLYAKYFGLYYNKKLPKPSFKEIKNSLYDKVQFGKFVHYRTGKDIGVTEEYVEEQVRLVLES